jgi:hypothetical protein
LDYTSRLRPPASKLADAGWTNPDFPMYVRDPILEGQLAPAPAAPFEIPPPPAPPLVPPPPPLPWTP